MNNTAHIAAVIFDWAGTTVDFGSVAPIEAFKALFTSEGIVVSDQECRAPMGTEKSEHIRQMLNMSNIKKQWLEKYDRAPNESDVQTLYHAFLPLQLNTIKQFSAPIPGCLSCMEFLKQNNIRVGSNTGYNEQMYAVVAETAKAYGFETEANVCATEVSKGRPYPYMAQAVMEKLEVLNAGQCIKVDDTETGIEEGLNAGMWEVGVSVSGNAVGLTEEQWNALSPEQQDQHRSAAEKKLKLVKPHYVIDSIADLPNVVRAINTRLANGERP